MINKAAHILVDLHESSYLLTFKEPVETAVLKELIFEFKKENKEKQKELYLKDVFLDFLLNKGYKDADITTFGATIDLHDYYKKTKDKE